MRVQIVEENIQAKLLDISLGNDFLELTPKAKVAKANTNKWEYIKLKSFCTVRETINRVKRQPTEWENNIFK